jgi:hypothetical protein
MGIENYYYFGFAEDSVAGLGVQANVYVIFIKFSPDLTQFNYYSQHIASPVGPVTTGVSSARLQIWVNDILITNEVYNAGSPPYPNSTYEFESGGISTTPANKVRVFAETWATANSSIYSINATIDQTYYIYQATDTLTIVDTSGNKNIILPTVNSLPANRIIKNISSSGDVFITTQDTDNLDDSDRKVVFLNQYECGTFVHANYEWLIANYYKNNVGTAVAFPTNTNKYSTSLVNRVNIFNTNSNTDRTSGDNGVILPAPEEGKMCIIVYAGNNCNKNLGNALLFKSSDSNGIDKRFNNSNSFPYILTDNDGSEGINKKSTGIIFISDGTYWYIVGWYNTSGISWSPSNTPVGASQIVVSNYINFFYLNTSPLTTSANYILPSTNISGSNDSYVFVLKNRNITGGNGIVLNANAIGSNIPNSFNETINSITNVFGFIDYGCVWLVSYYDGTKMRWYPIMNMQV